MSDTVTTTEAPVKAPKAPKAPKVPKEPKRGIGTVINEAILAGKTNEEALLAAKAEFPQSGTTAATVSWYRNNLRKKGYTQVPTARELKKKQEEAEAAEVAEAASQVSAEAAPVEADPLD